MGLRGTSLALAAALLAVGLLAASPFISRNLVGTGEAFNYSLSVGDALAQMRSGVVPPLAGQTEYAFIGRIHPLRNAPYLYYLAAAIDLVTLHRLAFWEVQNASMVLSLVALVFTCFWGLRWGVGCPRLTALLLSAVYGLSTPVLSAAHQLDLFMTVHAAVYVPLAVAACLRGCRTPSFSTDAGLAAALAATWLAHPPVALWLTGCVVLVRMVSFLRKPSWRILANGVVAVLLAATLSCFVFASVMTLSSELGYFGAPASLWRDFADVIMTTLRGAFPGAVLPVSRGAGELADLQFGYVPWALFALTAAFVLRRPRPGDGGARYDRFGAGATVVVDFFLLVLVIPVPFVTHWLWVHLPGPVLNLTTQWPMQRLYLVAVAFCVFGAGITLPERWREWTWPRWAAPVAIALGAVWTAYEAEPFINRGFHSRLSPESTLSEYRPSNLDVTITSYAFLGVPPTYFHGVIDPRFEFRILREGREEIASNLRAALATAAVVARGRLVTGPNPAPARTAASGILTLWPGHRYLLTFDFKTKPVGGYLEFVGRLLRRSYALPSPGEPLGFGRADGPRRTVVVWTDSRSPEEFQVFCSPAEGVPALGKSVVFADYTLRDVALDTLPVQLESLLPMRFAVDSPEVECAVETPRRYLSGYEAVVNGIKVTPLVSPYRQVMVPVPRGHSVVELRYVGPPLARGAFWLSAAAWLAFFSWRVTGSRIPRRSASAARTAAARLFAFLLRHLGAAVLVLVVLLGAAALGVRHQRQQAFIAGVGPMLIDFKLPFNGPATNQPLLSTGQSGAGVVVFVAPVDSSHIRIGADVWGRLVQSDPIAVDPFDVQTLVVSDSALFPEDHPRVKALAPAARSQLRGELTVELNGKRAIEETWYGYESALSQVKVGEAPFGSLAVPRFLGQIVRAERLPIPQEETLSRDSHAVMHVRFPADRAGRTEPLLTVEGGTGEITLCAEYLSRDKLRIVSVGSDGIRHESGEISYDPSKVHELTFLPQGTPERALYFDVGCVFDGSHVLGPSTSAAPATPPLLHSGRNLFAVAGVDARFTGPEMDLAAEANAPGVPAAASWGPLDLIVTFPSHMTGRHEPLLTSGKTGAGDFIYVIYEDGSHIRIGFDHWGGASALSGPIPVNFGVPHELIIRSGALYPDEADNGSWAGVPPAMRAALKSHVGVAFDGTTVLASETATHPCAPNAVTVGQNTIGGSTADPAFTGTVQFTQRLGVVTLPPD